MPHNLVIYAEKLSSQESKTVVSVPANLTSSCARERSHARDLLLELLALRREVPRALGAVLARLLRLLRGLAVGLHLAGGRCRAGKASTTRATLTHARTTSYAFMHPENYPKWYG